MHRLDSEATFVDERAPLQARGGALQNQNIAERSIIIGSIFMSYCGKAIWQAFVDKLFSSKQCDKF